MCVAVLLKVGTSLVDLKQGCVIINTNWIQFDVFGSGARMSIAINSSEPFAGKL